LKTIITFSLLNLAVASVAQTFPIEKEEYITVCKTIFAVEELSDTALYKSYQGVPTVFVLNNSDYNVNMEEKIDFHVNHLNVSIWFKADLFMEDIKFWIEVTTFKKNGNQILLAVQSVNREGIADNRPTIRAEFTLLYNNGEYLVESKEIKISH
jgi:hypothetical protein